MLVLPIKRKWYDMVLAGIKKEEYREIKPYYTTRFKNIGLLSEKNEPTFLQTEVIFRNGYSSNSPCFKALVTLRIRGGKEEWGAERGRRYYVLRIVEIRESD